MYKELSPELVERICEDRAAGKAGFSCPDEDAIRRDPAHDRPNIWRTPFIRDTEKILHSPYYNRYADKTQVFSFYRNDDLTRRSLHVQIVSRTARTLAHTLGLSADLCEAIALGHDIGHTPFGHAGESYLSAIRHSYCGRYFSHNIHSVRVLDGIFHHNLTLQTLNGIAAHNGEIEAQRYAPRPMTDFGEFDSMCASCDMDPANNGKWRPSTLEGCLVRICDMIAYLGKDRQDAIRIGLLPEDGVFTDSGIGTFNAEMMHNLEVDILENSYGKNEICMSPEAFSALSAAKKDNYREIYFHPEVRDVMENEVRPMMEKIYEKLRDDFLSDRRDSPIFRHHIEKVEENYNNRASACLYRNENADDIVTDYIASMTDDYFLDLYEYLFPDEPHKVRFVGYFG